MADEQTPELPDNVEPLRLADGRIVYPHGASPPAEVAAPELTPVNEPAFEMPDAPLPVVETQRSLDDLPDAPRVINAVCVALGYKLFGLGNEDIAHATGASLATIERIVESAAYEEMHQVIVRGVLDAEASAVRDMFQQYSRDAVGVLVETLKNGRRADRVSAARDLLDRAGHRPADVVEHRHRMDGGLTIEVVRRDGRADVPTINMEVGDD